MSFNNNSSLREKAFNSIKTILKNDLSATKPKIIKRGGTYTKKFLKYNEKLIKQKKTFYYLGDDKIYNPATGKFSELKKDKRFTKTLPATLLKIKLLK